MLAFPALFILYTHMATSPVDICNIALAHIGDRRITRLDDAGATTDGLVRYCQEFYALARNQALAAHRWSFAKTPVALSQEATPFLIGKFTYSHAMPSNSLRLLTVYRGSINPTTLAVTYNGGTVDDFKLVDGKLWSNDAELAIEYISEKTDPSRWSPHFQAAVARLLAHYLAGVVADNPGEAMRHIELYEKSDLPNAQFYDSVQDNSGENDDLGTIRSDSDFLKTRSLTVSSSFID